MPESESNEPSSHINLGEVNILIVDDEKELVKVYERYLKRYMGDIKSAHDGDEAWDLIQENRDIEDTREHFHVVLTDCQMPKVSGFELIKRMREKKINIPVLLSAGNPNCFEGYESFYGVKTVQKPIELKGLQDIINDVLSSVISN